MTTIVVWGSWYCKGSFALYHWVRSTSLIHLYHCLVSSLVSVFSENTTVIITLSNRSTTLIPLYFTFHPNKVQLFHFCCLYHEWIYNLTSLQKLEIWFFSILSKICEREVGEDWSKIVHIPCMIIYSGSYLSHSFIPILDRTSKI